MVIVCDGCGRQSQTAPDAVTRWLCVDCIQTGRWPGDWDDCPLNLTFIGNLYTIMATLREVRDGTV